MLPGHGAGAAETDQSLIAELETAIAGVRAGRIASPRTARWWHPTNAQKMAEEATEVVIEAVRGERSAVINESVDLIYNLAPPIFCPCARLADFRIDFWGRRPVTQEEPLPGAKAKWPGRVDCGGLTETQ